MKSEANVPESIKPYLDDIAARLRTKHAAVMVGSGFSKNANKNFPDWKDLGDAFYEKLHGKKPNETESRYLNPLKLAEELQALFGTPTLNDLLKSQIPNDESEPSILHTKLLELPWTDVFTTNYDTLLERACNKVTEIRYDVVINKDDLVYSRKPRIIKLHGSFPSSRPFIISEEDYRTYPKYFAPFVNTVQQSLIENTLCLIGFSGDDPNFLQWIGWIRDNLGNAGSSKIYFIGLSTISLAQKHLLEQRNIIHIDLSIWEGIEKGEHLKVINFFLDYLLAKTKKILWPNEPFSSPRISTSLNAISILAQWKNTRKSYPGWVILPEQQREQLWDRTKHWIEYEPNPAENSILDWVFELNWRLERCLIPISYNFDTLIKWALSEYESSPRHNSDDHKKYLSLALSLLRFYREDYQIPKWETLYAKINTSRSKLSPEQIAFLGYERCLFAFFKLDIKKLKEELILWPTNHSLPFWEAKRAGLFLELGKINEAKQILEKSLHDVRIRLNLKPIKDDDYSLISEESFIMMGFYCIENFERFTDIERLQAGLEPSAPSNKSIERWNYLKQFQCDPLGELKTFNIYLDREPVEKKSITIKPRFDLGSRTETHFSEEFNKEALKAYSFLRFSEECGLPFKLSKGHVLTYDISSKSAIGAIKRIAPHSFFWAASSLIRVRDKSAINILFDRPSLQKFSIQEIDNLVVHYINILKDAGKELLTKDNGLAIAVINFIPEILSRLCLRCSYGKKMDLLELVKNIYNSREDLHYRNTERILERLLASCTPQEQYHLIPKLLEIQFPENMTNPLQLNAKAMAGFDKIILPEGLIESLFDATTIPETRSRSLESLMLLYEAQLLNGPHVKKLSQILWEGQKDKYGFPNELNYYKAFYLDFPHPENISPIELFKKYIENAQFPILNEEGNGITSLHRIKPIDELILAHKINWSEKELSSLLTRLVTWWDNGKKYLSEKEEPFIFSSTSNEFRKGFKSLIRVLVEVLIPKLYLKTDSVSLKLLTKLTAELHDHQFSTIRIKIALYTISPVNQEELFSDISLALHSNEPEKIQSGLMATFDLMKTSLDSKRGLALLGDMIFWKHKTGLRYALKFANLILEQYPEAFEERLITQILIVLNDLASETDQTTDDIHDMLLLRQEAAYLAYHFYLYFKKNNLTIPKEVLVWQNICHSEKEFWEIRTQWQTPITAF